MVPPSSETFGVDANSGCFLLLEQVKGHVGQNSQIMWTVVSAHPTLVCPKGWIKDPMHAVFDAPST